MSKMRRIISGGEEGFTLIELLVVIAVLGILAAIAIPRMTGVTDDARNARAEADLRTVQTGLEMYYASNEYYPSDLTNLNTYINYDDISTTISYSNSSTATSYTITATGATENYTASSN